MSLRPIPLTVLAVLALLGIAGCAGIGPARAGDVDGDGSLDIGPV